MTDRDTENKLRSKSVKDKVKGKYNEVVGKGRSKLGDLTDNGSEHIKGKFQEIKGKVQQKKGEVEEDVADDLSVARDRRRTEDDEL
jgi:uncharacterized protein YjbJ (UPF0337 family)